MIRYKIYSKNVQSTSKILGVCSVIASDNDCTLKKIAIIVMSLGQKRLQLLLYGHFHTYVGKQKATIFARKCHNDT